MNPRSDNSVLALLAPAKVNLYLRVLGKRSDGFHELETLMATINLFDSLRFSARETGELTLACHVTKSPAQAAASESLLPCGTDNLVLRAARLLQQETGTRQGADIELIKRIPLAAGLAGGSSDAATTLLGLNRLWNLGLSRGELQQLAARLGSDIPFFLCGSPVAICRGRGEQIENTTLGTRLPLVIAKPNSGLSTALVFRHCQPETVAWSASDLVASLRQIGLAAGARKLHNTLQSPAVQLNADVEELSRRFARLPVLGHQMSGSGTSYFGMCHTLREARHLARRLAHRFSGHVFAVMAG